MMRALILLSLIFSSVAWSIPERDLPQAWSSKIEPFFRSLEKGTLKNKDGLTLVYRKLIRGNNSKSLVIVPGRTEPALKYAELIYDLRNSGFNIFIMDHQGQGESSRLLPDTHKGHVLNFSNYVKDLDLFISTVVTTTKPVYLIAHSMGGAISTRYMNAHPGAIQKAALVAPMFEMNTNPYSELVATLYAKFLVMTRKGANYAPGYGPYKPEEDTFEKNVYTHSVERFDVTKHIFVTYPDLVVNGPTAKWVHESLRATKSIHRLSVKTPVLMFQAGIDKIVKPARQEAFCKTHECELIHIPDAFHEILMEKDVIRDEVISEIRSFFEV